jgi:signal transduction histidine kinase
MHLYRDPTMPFADPTKPPLSALILQAYEDASSGGVLIIGADRGVLSRNRRFIDMWRLADGRVAESGFWALISGLSGRLADPSALVERLLDPVAFCSAPGVLEGRQVRLTDGRLLEIGGRSLDGSPEGAAGWVWYFREIEREARLAAALRKVEASERRAVRHEARLRDAIETIPGGFLLFDADERFVICNEAYRAMVPGAEPLLVPGTPLVDILSAIWDGGHYIGPLDRDTWLADRLDMFRNPRGPYEQLRADGRWLLVDERRTAEGGIAGIRVDITDLKRRETELQALNDALARREAQLRHLCGNIPGIVLQLRVHQDGSFEIPFVSDQIQDLCGLAPDAVTQDPMVLFDGVHADDQAELTLLSSAARDPGKPWRCSFRVVHATTGAVAWLRGGFVPTVRPDGSILWDGVLVDVTLLKSREEELVLATERALQANRAKTEFLANMSHELRTPLNAIIGFSDVMLSALFGPLGSPRYVDYVRDVRHSGQHLLNIINALLDIAKIEAGQMELAEAPLTIEELVADCLPLVRDKAAARGLELTASVPADLPVMNLDATRMRQVLLNLLSNSMKFTEPGGKIAIVAASSADGGIVLSVTDTGIGMTEDEVAVALEPFRQVDNTLARNYEGTGLGLPLARRFTELHGGSLEVVSQRGRGTEVLVWLPPERIVP